MAKTEDQTKGKIVLVGTTGFATSPKVRKQLKAGAEEIVVAHNHPSGDPTPSKADYDTTAKLQEAAKLLGVAMLDHIILGSPDSANGIGFVSLAEEAVA